MSLNSSKIKTFKLLIDEFRKWTLNLLNFLNGIIRLLFLEPSIIIFRDINEDENLKLVKQPTVYCVDSGQTAQKCWLAWLCISGNG